MAHYLLLLHLLLEVLVDLAAQVVPEVQDTLVRVVLVAQGAWVVLAVLFPDLDHSWVDSLHHYLVALVVQSQSQTNPELCWMPVP